MASGTFAPGPDLPWSARLAHAFAGLLMLADWLGSDERWFPYADGLAPDGPDRFAWSLDRAHAAVQRLPLDPARARHAAAALSWDFHALFPELSRPTPAQAVLLGALPRETQLVVLEAETGSGKTEAALLHFLALFRQGCVDGLYFALPTRTAAIQIHQRLSNATIRLLGTAAPPVGLAVPGYRRVDGVDLPLAAQSGCWPDMAEELLHDRFWAVERPKRYLAGAIMVGTSA